MTTDLSSTLAGIRERAHELTLGEHQEDHCGSGTPCTGHDALRLLAAIEAVLKLAGEAREIDADSIWIPCWTLDPADVREAIRAALTGKEAGDEKAAT